MANNEKVMSHQENIDLMKEIKRLKGMPLSKLLHSIVEETLPD